MSPLDRLLPLLNRVKRVGDGIYFGSCPTSFHKHGDRSAGLKVTELSDGTLMLHCFAGCPTENVLDTLGMTFSDLYPDKLDRSPQPRTNWKDACKQVSREVWIVSVAACDPDRMTSEDWERVKLAGERIRRIWRNLDVG